jgi:hypothetical protein
MVPRSVVRPPTTLPRIDGPLIQAACLSAAWLWASKSTGTTSRWGGEGSSSGTGARTLDSVSRTVLGSGVGSAVFAKRVTVNTVELAPCVYRSPEVIYLHINPQHTILRDCKLAARKE